MTPGGLWFDSCVMGLADEDHCLRSMATLVAVSPELAGLSHELSHDWTTIGRADGNAVKIPQASVSGWHCEVKLQGDELKVRDLCSTNGTLVEGRKISEAILKPGQTLRVGDVDLRFEAPAVKSAPATPFVNTMLAGAASRKPAPPPAPKPVPLPSFGGRPVTPAIPGEAAKKYQVLFVDDSREFIETFGELCCVLSNQTWKAHSAMSADQALAILEQHPVDLVVLDINMPMVDGMQLLGIIQRRHPGVRVAVLTGNATEKLRATCLEREVDLFMEKPVSADGSRAVFNMLNNVASWAPRQGFSGTLRQVGLQEVVQMECIGRRSAILEVRNQQILGEIYIETGAIIHANVGSLTGGEAFYRILSLGGGEFRLRPFAPPPQRTVDGSWECLLMEAARRSDEETAVIAQTSPAPTSEPPAPNAFPAPAGDPGGPDDEFVVVATYDGQWSAVDRAN
jgi:CheY-like chemotaxis protein